MFRFVKSALSRLVKNSRKHPTARVTRRARLFVEALEDRAVPTVSMLAPINTQILHTTNAVTLNTNLNIIHTPPIFVAMTNFSNVSFDMTSTSNGTNHVLQITSQTDTGLFHHSATFKGVWGDGTGTGTAATGTLNYDLNGNVHIQFTWANGTHSFDGTISGSVGHYHIDGNVTVNGGGGPGHVVGNEVPPNFTGIVFNMKSLTNGTTHQLKIQTQTDVSNGTATFTGLWDANKGGPGAPVTGTLSYDSSGKIHISFTFGDHSFDGTITPGILGSWHIDGNVTVPGGGGPGHVAGNSPYHLILQPITATLLNQA